MGALLDCQLHRTAWHLVVQFLGMSTDGRLHSPHRSDNTVGSCQQCATRPSCVHEEEGRASVDTLIQ